MIKEFDEVIIKKSNIKGVVVDIRTVDNKTMCIVESNERGVPGGCGEDDSYKLFDCEIVELERTV